MSTYILSATMVLLIALSQSNAAVVGNVFLQGQTDHSGILVRFLPQSASAREDSVITETSGRYEASIAGGLYKIEFSNPSYRTTFYRYGEVIAIAPTDQLDSWTLHSGNSAHVGGEVSGVWYSDTIYVVTQDIVIPSQQSLTIQPGTRIEFNGEFGIDANGPIIALGTAQSKIVFTSGRETPASGDWKMINMYAGGSRFENCLFEYFQSGIRSEQFGYTVRSCEFRLFKRGALYSRGSSDFTGNVLHDYESGDVSWAIWVESGASATIECNTIYNGTDYGIISKTDNTVRHNVISNIKTYTGRGRGIWLDNRCSPLISNNYITECRNGIDIGNSYGNVSKRVIVNNTICNCTNAAIFLDDNTGSAFIANNIVVNNNIGFLRDGPQEYPDTITHNLVWNNVGGNFVDLDVVGLGKILTTNNSGYEVDAYYNLSQDPLFVANKPPNLSPSSPCFTSGAPSIDPDIGFDSSLVCADNATSVADEGEERTFLASISPNPISDYATVNLALSTDALVVVRVYDSQGAIQFASTLTSYVAGQHFIDLDCRSLAQARYFVDVQVFTTSGKSLRVMPQQIALPIVVVR